MHQRESCPSTATLKEFLDQELNEHEDDEKFSYCRWDTTDPAILTTFTATYEEYKETLINVTDDLTRDSCTPKLKLPVLEATTGAKIQQGKSLGCILLGIRW